MTNYKTINNNFIMAEQRNITYVALLNPMYSPPAICLNFSWTFKYKYNILLQNDALSSAYSSESRQH